MTGIFKINSVYVVVRDKALREGIDINDSAELIINNNNEKTNCISLYADRVRIQSHDELCCAYNVYVDGIKIYDKTNATSLPIERVAIILNQIEFLGVDAYLNRYIKQLEKFKLELRMFASEIQHVPTYNEDNKVLKDIYTTIIKIESLLFSLYNNENLYVKDLEYETAHIEIINKYF